MIDGDDTEPQADGYSPTGVQILPSGAVLFTGIQLLADNDTADPPDDPNRRVTWIRESDSAFVGEVYVADLGGGEEHATLLVRDPDVAFKYARLDLQLLGGPDRASVLATAASDAGHQIGVTVIDAASKSNFPQLMGAGGLAPADVRISRGNSTITTVASRSATLAIAHNLGRTPDQILISSGNVNFITTYNTVGAVNFNGVVNHVDGTATSTAVPVSWVAIG